MIIDDGESLLQVVLTTVVIYVLLVALLRVTGKRTTSKMNSFDWIVTVAVGSMVATASLSPQVSIIEGLMGIGLLVFLQFLMSKLSVNLPLFRDAVVATPTLVFFRGQFLDKPMARQRVTREDILSAMRSQGFVDLSEVLAVVLESNADLSVVPVGDGLDEDETAGTLENVEGWPRDDG